MRFNFQLAFRVIYGIFCIPRIKTEKPIIRSVKPIFLKSLIYILSNKTNMKSCIITFFSYGVIEFELTKTNMLPAIQYSIRQCFNKRF